MLVVNILTKKPDAKTVRKIIGAQVEKLINARNVQMVKVLLLEKELVKLIVPGVRNYYHVHSHLFNLFSFIVLSQIISSKFLI